MTGHGRWAAACAAALLLGAGHAEAACQLAGAPVAVEMRGLRPTIEAKVNGKPVSFLVDSGAFFNGISAKFAYDQKMKAATTASTGTHMQLAAETVFSGAGGEEKVSALVQSDSFEFIGLPFKKVTFLTFGAMRGDTGIIGQNFLSLFDVEYDFKNNTIKLVTPQGCKDANLAYWATSGTAYSVMPLEWTDQGDGAARATVLINGVKMRAVFDTGADTSFITRRAAVRAGVKTTDPGVTDAGFSSGLDRKIKTWTARFASIKVGDEEIKNGQLDIGDSDADDFDILIGADFFLSHHVYVANSQRKIYFTYTGGRVFNISNEERTAANEQAQTPAK
jgi:predicted aspartyl protease